MIKASAPGKLILCGEHAVVYHRPAIALPIADVRAYVHATAGPGGSGLRFDAPDLGRSWTLDEAPDDPISQVATATLGHIGIATLDLTIAIRSDIPIASGMGSGAAIATAIVRTLAEVAGRELPAATVSALVYQSEKRYHGTPSGIDNTVVAYEQPIWFQRRGTSEQPEPPLIEPIRIATPFTLLIGDTGVRSATRMPVGEVRRRWQADPAGYDAHFDQIGGLVVAARTALELGDYAALGLLLNQNHTVLRAIGVSSPELDQLVQAALDAGALGAKLSGAGWGGVMIALVENAGSTCVREALIRAGAVRVLASHVEQTGDQAADRL